MMLFHKRQEKILDILGERKRASISQIFYEIHDFFGDVSKITINRDLDKLLQAQYIVRGGRGRAVFYELSPRYDLLRDIDPQKYFLMETDKREGKNRFDFSIFFLLKDIFTEKEKKLLATLNSEYRENICALPSHLRKREFERLVIEFSWKSSQIEGNTYSLLETEVLLTEKKEAPGHKKEEAVMILNHKDALDYIRKNRNIFRTVSVSKTEDIHFLLTKELGISRGLRTRSVGITGTRYRPLDTIFQIREALETMCRLVNDEKDPFHKVLFLMILIAYIQPFEDGNKRTSRLLGNGVLMAHDICPLSYRSVDEVEYKKAVILFYERSNIAYFKKLFLEQFEFAVKNYFRRTN